MDTVIADARSLLFVPGNRPERFAKALGSGADAVVIDLEDAVSDDRKGEARRTVRDWLVSGDPRVVVRVNSVGTAWHDDDIDALVGCPPVTVMVPKASVAAVAAVRLRLPAGAQLIALVETAAGVLEAPAIAGLPGVVRLALGNVDLSAELGVDPGDHQALAGACSMLVLASAAAGLAAPIDGVTTAIRDQAQLERDTQRARSLGFAGKLCIHPAQIAAVHRTLAPTAAELAEAERIVAAAGDGDVTVLDGAMIDRPVVERARRRLRGATHHTHTRG